MRDSLARSPAFSPLAFLIAVLLALVSCAVHPLPAQTMDTTRIPVSYLDSVPVVAGIDSTVERVDTTWHVVTTYRDSVFSSCCRDSLVIVPKPPPPAVGTNEPAGFVRLTSRSCDAVLEDGWTLSAGGAFTIVTDPVQGKVCQTIYPAGFKDGRAPVTTTKLLPSKPQQIYIRFRLAVSANFMAHVVWNKGFHQWIGGSNRGIIGLYTTAAAYHVQNVTSAAGKPGPSVVIPGRGPFANLTWHTHEVLLTTGASGHVTYWLDGKQFVSQPINWGTASGMEAISWSPTYGGYLSCGGLQCTVPATMQVWWDDLYVSGR